MLGGRFSDKLEMADMQESRSHGIRSDFFSDGARSPGFFYMKCSDF